VTPAFISAAAGRKGRLRAYVDEPDRFWQAVAVVQKT
jgi:hypothetical protein